MIGYILIAVAFFGSSIASYFDLKTTDVPDLIAIYMAIAGIVLNAVNSYLSHNSYFIISSLIVGGIFSILGAINYYAKLWGGADFLLLGALGFILPYNPLGKFGVQIQYWPFPVSLLLNILLIGATYTILYSFYIAFRKQGTIKLFFSNLRKNKKGLIGLTFFYIFLLFFIPLFSVYSLNQTSLIFIVFLNVLKIAPLFFALVLLYFFLKTIQYDVLDKIVNTKELKIGDVLAEKAVLKNKVIPANKIVGLTKEQVSEIKKELNSVKITQGVPYIPVFPIAVLVTIFAGDLVSKIIFSAVI